MANEAEIRKHNADILQKIKAYAAEIQKAAKSIQTRPSTVNIRDQHSKIEYKLQSIRLLYEQLWD